MQDRLNLWLRHTINTQLESIMQLAEPADLEGAARGIAFRLSEHLGLIPRSAVADEVKGLDQDVRGKMRKLGVKFGAYHIYVPISLKPAPRELALILWALKNGGVRQPGVSDLPQIVLSGRTSVLVDPEVDPRLYEVAGFKVAGKRAVRVDILERLADIIRPLIALDPKRHEGELPAGAAEGNGFRVTVEMTSLLGTAGEDFASILSSLGYRLRRTPKVAAEPTPVETPTEAASETPVETAAEAPVLDDDAASRAVEGRSSSDDEATSIDAATADLGAPGPSGHEAAPVAETASAEATAEAPAETQAPESAAPAEPEFDEVWFPGGRRPDAARGDHRKRFNRPPNGNVAEATAEGDARPRRFNRDNKPGGDGKPQGKRFEGRRDGAPGGKPGNGKPQGGKRDKGRDEWKEHRPREQRETRIDPDSPWAALAALKNPKA